MLDELYDDVLSVMKEKGFIEWFPTKNQNKVSPLKWCYEQGGDLKHPPTPPKDLSWVVNSYDHFYHPNTLIINDEGYIGPR